MNMLRANARTTLPVSAPAHFCSSLVLTLGLMPVFTEAAVASDAEAMDVRRPNILLLVTDQQRFDSLGCYGAGFAHTPNLDRLAAGGAVFERCYVTNTICTPSRASLMTGKQVPEHGVYRLYDNLPKDEVLFPERLLSLGYRTALFGKLHVSAIDTEANERHPHDGFEIYEPCIEGVARMEAPYQAYARWLSHANPGLYKQLLAQGRGVKHLPQEWHLTRWAADRTINFLENHERVRPFFVMMSVFEPHNPYDGYPVEMAGLVDADKIPEPIAVIDPAEPGDIDRERRDCYLGAYEKFTPAELRQMRRDYHAAVAYTDLEIGRVLDRLDELDLAEDTLVLFTSDHGDQIGDHRLFIKGAAFFEASVRVPLILRWPRGVKAGQRVTGLAQLHDIAATVLDAAGFGAERVSALMPDAHSLLPLADGRAGHGRETAVSVYRNSGINYRNAYWDPPIHAEMICDERFKLTLYHDTTGQGRGDQGQLFDLQNDPGERQNLWGDTTHGAVRARLTAQLEDWNQRWDKYPPSRGGSTPPRQLMKNSLK